VKNRPRAEGALASVLSTKCLDNASAVAPASCRQMPPRWRRYVVHPISGHYTSLSAPWEGAAKLEENGRPGDLTQGEETYAQLFNEIGRLKRDFSPRSGKGGALAGISHYGFGRAGL
jgi:hypothetical protein